MQWFEILIIVISILFVLGVIFLSFYMKKKGKSLLNDCGGDCSKCSGNCTSCGHACSNNKKLIEEYRKSIKNS